MESNNTLIKKEHRRRCKKNTYTVKWKHKCANNVHMQTREWNYSILCGIRLYMNFFFSRWHSTTYSITLSLESAVNETPSIWSSFIHGGPSLNVERVKVQNQQHKAMDHISYSRVWWRDWICNTIHDASIKHGSVVMNTGIKLTYQHFIIPIY